MYAFLNKIDWVKLNEDVAAEEYQSKFKTPFRRLIGTNHKVFIDSIFDILSSVQPIKVDDKYSATATFAAIGDYVSTPYFRFTRDQFRGYFQFITQVAPTVWVINGVGKTPEFSSLVPIMLAAYKKNLGIKYEEWDFDDPALSFMMNPMLFDMIQYRNVDFSGVDKGHLREEVLYINKTGESYPVTRYPTGKKVRITDEIDMNSNKPLALMLSQVWVANALNRIDLMVLDPNDWDAIPEAMDALVADVVTKPSTKLPF